MSLNELWFIIIAVLWIGYFVLEGFDFGVGIVLRPVGRSERGRRVLVNAIGPVWDGNEVWLVTAGGATFAAFPHWYASLFSAAYLPLLLILVCLIVRGVAFEYRGKGTTDVWRRNWDLAISSSSILAAVLWGAAWGSIVHGIPLRADHEFTGNLFSFLTPYALATGVLTFTLFALHGSVFLALKTSGAVRDRARSMVRRSGITAAVLMAAVAVWTPGIRGGFAALHFGPLGMCLALVGAAAVAGSVLLTARSRDGWAFVVSAGAVALLVISWFVTLFPLVLPSSTDPRGTLDIISAASGSYSLGVMSWVALALVPFVLAYQAWSYWVFRKRISERQIPPSPGSRQEPAQVGVGHNGAAQVGAAQMGAAVSEVREGVTGVGTG